MFVTERTHGTVAECMQSCYIVGQQEICSLCPSYVSCHQYGTLDYLKNMDNVPANNIVMGTVLAISLLLNLVCVPVGCKTFHRRYKRRANMNPTSLLTSYVNAGYQSPIGSAERVDIHADQGTISATTAPSRQSDSSKSTCSRGSEKSDGSTSEAVVPEILLAPKCLIARQSTVPVQPEEAESETSSDPNIHSELDDRSSLNSSANGILKITDFQRDVEDTVSVHCGSMSSVSLNSDDKGRSKFISWRTDDEQSTLCSSACSSENMADYTNVDNNISLEQDDKTVVHAMQRSETSYSDTSSFEDAASSRRDHNTLSDAHHNNVPKSRAIAVTLSVSSKDDESENNVKDNTSVQCESMSSVSLSYTDQSTHEDV